MSFPIIGASTQWSNWFNFGSTAWQMWFMAPYGSWIYAGFVKSGVTYFKKIYTGITSGDYPMENWVFALASDTPETDFLHELQDGYPDGAMGAGCIRGTGTPHLYVLGRLNATPDTVSVLRKYDVEGGFDGDGILPTYLTYDTGEDGLNINHICGIEVFPGESLFVLTNNRDGREFELRRYDESAFWNDGEHDPTHILELSDVYMENNNFARIRGIGHSSDGNILVFINSGESVTSNKVLKFARTDLAFLGQTTWTPDLQGNSEWGYVIQSAEVFTLFRGLDEDIANRWRTAIYYDRATSIPEVSKSNFIIEDNLTSFGDDNYVLMQYRARDAFNLPVTGVNAKFILDGEDENDPDTWTDRTAGIQGANDAEEVFDTGDGGTTYTGILSDTFVLPGSVEITAEFTSVPVTAVDDGAGNLSGTNVDSGTVNYNTGVTSITYTLAPDSENIVAVYQYLDSFFDSDGVPTAISAVVPTNASGVAEAYYKAMREGSGTEIDAVNVFCPVGA